MAGAVSFCYIHGLIGATHEDFLVIAITGVEANADAGVGKEPDSFCDEYRAQCFEEMRDYYDAVFLIGHRGQQDAELISPESGDGVFLAQATAQAYGYFFQ